MPTTRNRNVTTGQTTNQQLPGTTGNGQARPHATRRRSKGARGRTLSTAGAGAIPGLQHMTADQRRFYDMGARHERERCGITTRG